MVLKSYTDQVSYALIVAADIEAALRNAPARLGATARTLKTAAITQCSRHATVPTHIVIYTRHIILYISNSMTKIY